MIDLSSLWVWDYWVNTSPGGEFILGYGLLIFFLALFLAPGVLKSRARHHKNLKKSLKKRLMFFRPLGVFGFIFIAARYSDVPYFSMRIWLYITLVLSLILLIRNSLIIYRDYKKRCASVERERSKA